jgi:hypothetical protein
MDHIQHTAEALAPVTLEKLDLFKHNLNVEFAQDEH